MSSRLLLNLALVSIAIALALVIHFQLGIEPEPLPQPITSITDSNAISSIRIERTQREPLFFQRRDKQWQLQVDHHALPGSEFQLRSLLRLPQATRTTARPRASRVRVESFGAVLVFEWRLMFMLLGRSHLHVGVVTTM